jgi:predicted GNAT family N-acyltransferase
MAPVSAPGHEITVVTPERNELRQQCYDIRIAVFVSEQGELFVDFDGPAVTITARFLCR